MRRAWLLALCIAALGCATSAAPAARAPGPAIDPGLIRAPDVMPYDFQWRQHVTAIWPTGRRSFDAVVQKRAGELLMIGLSPMGMPGFILHLKPSGAISVENHTGQDLPFRAEYILADVQRVLFPWLPAAPAGLDGERSGAVGDVQVSERYLHGALVARTFQRGPAADSGKISIRYEGLARGADVANRVNVANGWFGYRLEIETLSYARLTAAPQP
jgi:hypothetical protein